MHLRCHGDFFLPEKVKVETMVPQIVKLVIHYIFLKKCQNLFHIGIEWVLHTQKWEKRRILFMKHCNICAYKDIKKTFREDLKAGLGMACVLKIF